MPCLRAYTDKQIYINEQNNIYTNQNKHYILFYIKNDSKFFNEIRWMQEVGKFSELSGTQTQLDN